MEIAMKRTKKLKKWKILVVVIWIAALAAACIGCMSLQRANIYEKAKTELVDQATIISGQFTSLVDTNFYTRAALIERQLSELKAISFVLENCEDIDQAGDFLENVVNTTEVKNLWIYDREGKIIFGSGTPKNKLEPEYVSTLLDTKAYKAIEGAYSGDERYRTTTYYLEDDGNGSLWGVKDRWLVQTEENFSDIQKNVMQFFDWQRVIQDISIGRDGVVLAVSEALGSVLSYSNSDLIGKPVENLNIRLAGEKDAATVDRLREVFSQTGEVTEISVDSVRYFATRMDIDNDLFLVMFPVSALETAVENETVILMMPLTLITGIGVLYLFSLANTGLKQAENGSEKKGRLIPVGKLKVFTILAVILVFVISLYLETHLVYAQMFQYTSTTAEEVMEKKNVADSLLKELHAWLQEGKLEKSKIARCCIQHPGSARVDRQYVSDLAKRLNVSYVYVYDKQGKVSLTNGPYDGYIIDGESPFHVLLEGTESVVLQPEQQQKVGEMQQEAGVTMIDEQNLVEGAVVIKDTTYAVISDEVSFETVFQRVFLKDNTVVMAVNSEDMTVQYFAQVEGSFFASDRLAFDYTQVNVAALGMDETQIRDHFNGEMFAIDNQFFASVRRSDNAFLMVLRPLVFIEGGNLLSIIFVTAAALIFFIFLICMGKGLKKDPEEDAGAEELQAQAQKKPASAEADINDVDNEDDVITLLGSLTDRKKPYFEERWPSDGKRWREKNPMEKFSAAVKIICISFLALIVVQGLAVGKNSIWYYCFNGEWSSGINLYSITSCIISIILLVLLKEIVHKVLYLIARATERKGESICHLLNSFSGYVVFFAGVFIILGTLGVNVAAMSLTAGVAGVIFGIGCQNIVADILAGIIMVFEGVACAGDFVSFNGNFGVIQTIGIRTTKLKWFSEITIVRNNEFKNYINMPGDEVDRVVVYLLIDLKESLTRVESVIDQELPKIRDNLCETTGDEVKIKYRGVQGIEENGIKLSFAVFCKGMYYGWSRRLLSRELLLMCERNGIRIAMPQIVINERD